MEIFIIIILVIMISISLYFIFKSKTNKNDKINEDKNDLVIDNNINYFPDIQIVEDSTIVPLEKNKIIDKQIKSAISVLDNSVTKTAMTSRNLKNANNILNNKKAFFSTAKKGTENMIRDKSTNTVIGTQMVDGKFSKQTRFLSEDKMIKSYGKDALVNAGFNATSMVVGQYYMSEINDKLEDIQQDINGISNYLDSEYQGKLAQIVSKIQEIIDNKVEILNNEYSRDKRYNEVLDLETNCATLLGQANNMIKESKINEEIDYKKYEENLKEINKWFIRQQILQKLLLEIGNLRYILSNGNETSKLSHTQYNTYLKQTNNINEELTNWHKTNCERLGIDLENSKRKASFYRIKKNTIGRINEEWAYHKLEDNTLSLINGQTNIIKMLPYTKNKQDEIIKIQKYKGEYYNLLPDTK